MKALTPAACASRPGRALPCRGYATLMTVLVLFMILALTTAYFNRSMLFNQIAGTQSYQMERARQASRAGVDFAMQLLNAGRIDAYCRPSTNLADQDLRGKMWTVAPDGSVNWRISSGSVVVACAHGGGALDCRCATPAEEATTSWDALKGGVDRNSFIVRFNILKRSIANADSPSLAGQATLTSFGCGNNSLTSDTTGSCLGSGSKSLQDGYTSSNQYLALMPAIANVPPAPLTVGGTILTNTSQLWVVNTHSQTGVTIHSAKALDPAGNFLLQAPAGAPDDGRQVSDYALDALVPTASSMWTDNDAFFRSTFQITPDGYRSLPGTIKLPCPTSCSGGDLLRVVRAYPNRAIWIDGDLNLVPGTFNTIGTSTEPLTLIVKGKFTYNTNAPLVGFVYASQIEWGSSAAMGSIRGALVTPGNLTMQSGAKIFYDRDLLRWMSGYIGSYVKPPNSFRWR